MRVYGVESDGRFTDYEQLEFQTDHAESDLEDWLKENPDCILEAEQLMLLGRQVVTDLGGSIDLLGVDREGRTVVVELKRDRTPRDVIAQALEYAAFAKSLDLQRIESLLRHYEGGKLEGLAERHRAHFALAEADVVAFNKDQRIIIVAQQVTPAIRETASFLESKGVLIACVEFSFFRNEQGRRLLTLTQKEVTVGRRPQARSTPTLGSEEEFLRSCNKYGREVFRELLRFARRRDIDIKLSRKSFTARVVAGGRPVVVCYCYLPDRLDRQFLYTAFTDQYGILKTEAPAEVVARLRETAQATGLFTAANNELKVLIDRPFTESEVDRLLAWSGSVQDAIIEHSRSV